VAIGALAPSAQARGCPARQIRYGYHPSAATKRHIKQNFARSHRGYRILSIRTSLEAPDGYAGLYYFHPPSGPGGVAYYCYGSPVRHPARDAIYGFSVGAFYIVTSDASGTYTEDQSSYDSSSGDTTGSKWVDTFHWHWVYGSARHPLGVNLVNGSNGEEFAEQGTSGSGSGSGTYQRYDQQDPSQNYSCTYPISGSGGGNLGWDSVPHHPGILQFYEGLNMGQAQSPSDPNCTTTNPGDPGGAGSLTFQQPLIPPGSVNSGASAWNSFSPSPGFHHHSHESSSDSGITYNHDKDLVVSYHIEYKLVRIVPVGY
jgi:hypothetical protein